MNQIQFWILNGFAALLGIFLISHIFLTRYANYEQNLFYAKQNQISLDQAYLRNAQAIASAISAEAIKNPTDTGLKNLAIKFDISTTPAPAPAGGSSTGSGAPSGGGSTGGTSTGSGTPTNPR